MSWPSDPFATFEEWAGQLNCPWPTVLKLAKVANPADGSRSTRSRAREGGAPRAVGKLFAVLRDLEKKRETPTALGAVLVGLDEWQGLGTRLAELDADAFLHLLGLLRSHLAAAEAAVIAAEAKEQSAAAMVAFGNIHRSKKP